MENVSALRRARSLLSVIQTQGQELFFEDSKQAAEALACPIVLIRSFRDSPSISPSSADWKVLRACMELLVRIGIVPYLSPGVGITRERQSPSKGYFAAASAISDHLAELNVTVSDEEGICDCNVLFTCAEVLASLIWDIDAENAIKQKDMAPMPALGQLVVTSFLWDVLAAYLQLGFGSQPPGTDEYCRQTAQSRVNAMVEIVSVPQMVQACFLLLHHTTTKPPAWLKSELGRQLSKLVMRRGGVVAILQELVGHTSQGNVKVYDKISAHLAKVPKSIVTVEEYLRAICPQILPLLLFHSKSMDSKEGNTSRMMLKNVHFTALSLACRLSAMEPSAVESYFIEPLLKPLLSWTECSFNEDRKRECYGENENPEVTETELISCLVQMSVLLTAGQDGAGSLQRLILKKAKSSVSLLLRLHMQVENALDSSPFLDPGGLALVGKKISQYPAKISRPQHLKASVGRRGIGKGFLNKGLGYDDGSEESFTGQSILLRLRVALGDIVMGFASQPVEEALPFMRVLLFDHDKLAVKWPNEKGEVWDLLTSKPLEFTSNAMYLSRLLVVVENWQVIVALMGTLLNTILDVRRSIATTMEEPVVSPLARAALMHMENFEVLSNQAGAKALEHDNIGAVSLVKSLLDDPSISTDGDTLELVLHMVHSILDGVRKMKQADMGNHEEGAAYLSDLVCCLEKVYENSDLEERARHMSFTLMEETLVLSKA